MPRCSCCIWHHGGMVTLSSAWPQLRRPLAPAPAPRKNLGHAAELLHGWTVRHMSFVSMRHCNRECLLRHGIPCHPQHAPLYCADSCIVAVAASAGPFMKLVAMHCQLCRCGSWTSPHLSGPGSTAAAQGCRGPCHRSGEGLSPQHWNCGPAFQIASGSGLSQLGAF